MALNDLELKRLELRAREEYLDLAHSGSFDINRNVRLVPPFVERDILRRSP